MILSLLKCVTSPLSFGIETRSCIPADGSARRTKIEPSDEQYIGVDSPGAVSSGTGVVDKIFKAVVGIAESSARPETLAEEPNTHPSSKYLNNPGFRIIYLSEMKVSAGKYTPWQFGMSRS